MRLTLCEAQTRETRPETTTPGTTCPTLSDKWVGSLTFPAIHETLNMQETELKVYSPIC